MVTLLINQDTHAIQHQKIVTETIKSMELENNAMLANHANSQKFHHQIDQSVRSEEIQTVDVLRSSHQMDIVFHAHSVKSVTQVDQPVFQLQSVDLTKSWEIEALAMLVLLAHSLKFQILREMAALSQRDQNVNVTRDTHLMDTSVSLATMDRFPTLGKKKSITETAYKLMVKANLKDHKEINCGRVDKCAKPLLRLINAWIPKSMVLQINAISVNHAQHLRMVVFRPSQMHPDSDAFFQLLIDVHVTKSIARTCQDVCHVTMELMKMEI